jgi:hypothetical protein
MPDLTNELLPHLRGRLLGSPGSASSLDLGNEMFQPAYAGGSILNLPASICRLLGAPELGANPLLPEIHSLLDTGEIRRVILILVDALSLLRFQRWIDSGNLPFWKGIVDSSGALVPLTSILPSTTSAALTSLWTGRAACEHGIAGYELWLKEYGMVANMILHSPMSFRGSGGHPGSLSYAGFEAETYLTFPTLGAQLAASGVKAYAYQHISIAGSGISRMLMKDVTIRPFSVPSELMINLRQQLDTRPDERAFIWIYWGEIDHLSHFYTPDDERPLADFAAFTAALETLFLERLRPEARPGTLLLMTADHGQIVTRPDPHYDLRNHPGLVRRLHMLPTGENRLAYLFIRPGQTEAVREYIERTWPDNFLMLEPAFAVEAGLFGPGPVHPRLLDRLGDLILVSRGEAYLWWGAKENHLFGRHGGLSEDEMLVPLLAMHL